MSINLAIEKRERDWYADVRGVPGTGSLGPTQEAAIAGAMRKLAEKVERRETNVEFLCAYHHGSALDVGLANFTGADMLALWKTLPHPDPGWADAVEEASRSQPLTSGESPWDP